MERRTDSRTFSKAFTARTSIFTRDPLSSAPRVRQAVITSKDMDVILTIAESDPFHENNDNYGLSRNLGCRVARDFLSGQLGRAAAIPAAGLSRSTNAGQAKKTRNPGGKKGSHPFRGKSKKSQAVLPAQSKPAAGLLPRRRLAIWPFLLSRGSPDFEQALSRILHGKGVPHQLHIWQDRAHSGHYWRRMARIYIQGPRFPALENSSARTRSPGPSAPRYRFSFANPVPGCAVAFCVSFGPSMRKPLPPPTIPAA